MSEYNIKLDDVTIYRGIRSFNVRIISELFTDMYVELTCKNEIYRALGHLCAHIG